MLQYTITYYDIIYYSIISYDITYPLSRCRSKVAEARMEGYRWSANVQKIVNGVLHLMVA